MRAAQRARPSILDRDSLASMTLSPSHRLQAFVDGLTAMRAPRRLALVRDAALPVVFVAAGASLVPGIATAQESLQVAEDAATAVQTTLLIVGPILVIGAAAYAGAKLLFSSAAWRDVQNVFWGGVIIGAATTFGGWVLGLGAGGAAPGGGAGI